MAGEAQTIIGVPRAELASHWYAVEPLIERMIARDWAGRYSLEAIREGIEEGDLQLWRWRASVILTQLRQHPGGKECLIFGVAGNLDAGWEQTLSAIIESSGCDWASAYARPGFEPLLRGEGWRKRQVIMTKKINGQLGQMQ